MRRVGLLVLALALLLVAASPAAAATSAARIARALERSPLYVDPSLDDAVPAVQRRAVRRAIDRAPYPVYAVLIPLVPGDRYDGEARRFLSVLHGRLARDGVYVTVAERVVSYRAYGVEEERPDLNQVTTTATFEDPDFDEPQIGKLRRFAELLSAPDLAARYEQVEARLAEQREESERTPAVPAVPAEPDGTGDDDGGGAAWVGAGFVAAAAVGGGVALRRRRRRARPAGDTEPAIPERVFEHARAAEAEDLREEVDRRLLAFAERVDRTDSPSREAAHEHQQHALDAYAAARRVLQSEPRLVDLAGALVLAERGKDALAAAAAVEAGRPAPEPSPPCFFDPRHPGRAKRVAWRDGVTVRACPACARALATGKAPDALLDDGRPWFETDSLWARTGFGAFEDDLAARVLRGELRSAR